MWKPSPWTLRTRRTSSRGTIWDGLQEQRRRQYVESGQHGFVTPTLYSHDFCLAIDPSNPSTMYAASGHSVYKSMDGGST